MSDMRDHHLEYSLGHAMVHYGITEVEYSRLADKEVLINKICLFFAPAGAEGDHSNSVNSGYIDR